jgi:hypothetical protein
MYNIHLIKLQKKEQRKRIGEVIKGKYKKKFLLLEGHKSPE